MRKIKINMCFMNGYDISVTVNIIDMYTSADIRNCYISFKSAAGSAKQLRVKYIANIYFFTYSIIVILVCLLDIYILFIFYIFLTLIKLEHRKKKLKKFLISFHLDVQSLNVQVRFPINIILLSTSEKAAHPIATL